MSLIRYGFGFSMIIIGIFFALILGGMPSQGDEPLKNFFFSTLLYSFGLGLFTWGFGRFRKLQLVRNTPTSKIRSIAMGNVEVKGKSKIKEKTFSSPFSNKESVYCKYKIEEYYEDDDGGDWRTKLSEEKRTEFNLDDSTGEITVNPEGANFRLPIDNSTTVRDHEDLPENIKSFLRENKNVDIQEGGWLSNKRDRRYKEWYITPGEQLYIYGYAGTENGNTVIEEGNSPMYMISDKSEKELRDNWSTSYKLMILGGIALTAIGFYLMAATTGAV